MTARHGSALTHDGDALAWKIAGDGPSMLIMNGLVSSVDPHWTKWIRHYSRTHGVLTWDYRGHGASPEPRDAAAVSIERFADDGAVVLEASGLPKPAVVCGLSMGVQTALEFTRRHPASVRGLVLLCGTAGHALNVVHGSPQLRSAVTGLLRGVETVPARFLRALSTSVLRTPIASEIAYRAGGVVRGKTTPGELSEILRHATARSPRVISRIFSAYLNHSAWETLGAISVPTLIVAGDRDDLVPLSIAERMHREISGSQIHVVRGHGHLAQVENPAEVHGVVDAFLAKHGLE